MDKSRSGVLALSVALLLSGCALFSAGSAEPVPIGSIPGGGEPPETGDEIPTPSPEAPVEEAAGEVSAVEPTASAPTAGEVIFVRDGEIWAIGVDGSSERQLTALGGDTSPTELALSPDGAHLAFVLGAQLYMLDFTSGAAPEVHMLDMGIVNSPVWSLDSVTLYYWKLLLNAEGTQPETGQLWAVGTPVAGSTPEAVLESSLLDDPRSWLPRYVLVDEVLVVQHAISESGDPGEWLLFNLADGASKLLVEGYHVWDVSPDRSRGLLASHQDMIPSLEEHSLPLYMAELSPSEGALNIIMISPETATLSRARFAADGERVIALQDILLQEGGTRAVAVVLSPAGEGGYNITLLDPEPDFIDVAIAWHPLGVIVERWSSSGEGNPTLWLMPVDGLPGEPFATGRAPLVVGSP